MIETKFKRTEVGIIPRDWNVVTIETIGEIITGTTPSTNIADYYGEDYCFVSPFDLGCEKYINKTNKNLSLLGIDVCRKIPKGAILYTCTGSTIGKIGIANKLLATNQQINSIVVNSNYSNEYVYYALQTRKENIRKLAAVQAVPLITKGIFAKTKFACPKTTQEQERIGIALSDIDDLIISMRKLIEKKRNIKIGVMQNLLSGQKRLKGFTKKWTEIPLKEFKPKKGTQINKNTLDADTLGYPVMNGGIAPSGYNSEYNSDANTITISEGGNSCGFVNLMKSRFWAGGHCYTLTVENDMSVGYIFQTLKFYESQIMALRTGSGLPNIKKTTLYEFKILISLQKEEQEAIAKVFSDMDAEIEYLEFKLSKYENIKQGMMQQLLTGKIRLI